MIDLASIGSVYQEGIVDAGKEPAFLFLVAFLGAFGFIRTSAHMIRAQVSWWPGNVEVGGTHIHHLVWGILVILISGWISIAIDPGSPGEELVAIAFGIGTGLTLDEFALWLELKDVYWSEEGRKSIDAVIVAAIVAALGVLGFTVLVDVADDLERWAIAVISFFGLTTLIFVALVCLKGKFGMAAIGLIFPPVAWVSAVRLAKPDSLWARRYDEERKRRAEERFGCSDDDPRPDLPAKETQAPAAGAG